MTGCPSFEAFFASVHGYPPFPWQVRLADRVGGAGGWPSLLDLPTGVGKTTAIDIALYALAKDPRASARRIFLVVDRRLIVDQAADHARHILKRLRDGVCPGVTDRLRSLFGADSDADPFHVAVLRGGIPRDADWVRRPDQPVVALSTVDQVGSRLLFRGYGVSPRMAPVHAGLVGTDALFLLDEVHLSEPFEETLAQIESRWRMQTPWSDRFSVVRMSATPGAASIAGEERFGLDAADRAHPVLARRLGGRKPTSLVSVRVIGDEPERRQALAEAAAREVMTLLGQGARIIGVVLNRVETARRVWRAVETDPSRDAVLLTGRMRSMDRDSVLTGDGGVLERARAGRPRAEGDRPLVIVATQTIEAGADLDFDALVTECASLDALRQRFGRLDRRGDLGRARGVVLIRSDQMQDSSSDPVYGAALARTAAFLAGFGDGLDFGLTALAVPDAVAPLLSPRSQAPILLPAHLDAWVQTSPVPAPDPDISLWLHGTEPTVAELSIVWRSELDAVDLASVDLEAIADALAACPPRSAEALTVPLYAAKAWLADGTDVDVADVEGAAYLARGGSDSDALPLAVRWTGDGVERLNVDELRPGDTLVVPCGRGGLTANNWDPTATEPVTDLGDLAQLRAAQAGHGRVTLRLWPAALRTLGLDDAQLDDLPQADKDEEEEGPEPVATWLGAMSAEARGVDADDSPLSIVLDALAAGYRTVALANGHWVLSANTKSLGAAEPSTESENGSFLAKEVTLAQHGRDVRDWAARFVTHLGLPEAVGQDVVLAAHLHDIGKADPRFQRWLCGGSEVRWAMQEAPLAKSSLPGGDRRQRENARRRARYPRGERHELLSLALLERNSHAVVDAHDPDLVLHLVASHHGWCRPFAPARDTLDDLAVSVEVDGLRLCATTRHRLARLDSGISDRFWRLIERYGYWGLAWLEALVRLADHRASEQESTQ